MYQVREWLRTKKVAKATISVGRSLSNRIRDNIGYIQLRLNHELTVAGTARVALEQWKSTLENVPTPLTGRLLFAAIRNRRWTEWTIYSACYLLRMGYEPTIIFSGRQIAGLYGTGSNSFWAAAQDLPFFHWIDLDLLMVQDDTEDYDEFVQKAAHTVAAYDLEVEEYEAGQASGEYEQAVAQAKVMLKKYALAVEHILRQYSDQRLICPSGIIGESLAIHEAARRLNREVMYVEGWALRPGHNIWNLNRPALEYDVEGWLHSIGEWSDEIERDARDYMDFREGRNVDRDGWLDNFHQVQHVAKEVPLPLALDSFLKRDGQFVLLGTNVVGDSSTLRRQTIFRSQQDWLDQSIAFFKQHPEINLIVRTHPDETWVHSRLRLADFAHTASDGAQNVFVVDSKEKVNTYQLVDRCDLGLAWVSNIGLDMALRGKPVIMGAKPKYTGLGIVHEPTTTQEYFQLIAQLLAHPIVPDQNAVRRGKAYHNIVFKLLSLESDDRHYNTANYRLGDKYMSEDQHKFYRILAGELDNYGQPIE